MLLFSLNTVLKFIARKIIWLPAIIMVTQVYNHTDTDKTNLTTRESYSQHHSETWSWCPASELHSLGGGGEQEIKQNYKERLENILPLHDSKRHDKNKLLEHKVNDIFHINTVFVQTAAWDSRFI